MAVKAQCAFNYQITNLSTIKVKLHGENEDINERKQYPLCFDSEYHISDDSTTLPQSY